eukprot:11006796-Ditylum_brightwellii.AAC.1
MTPTVDYGEPDSAAATFTYQEISPSMVIPYAAIFSPITTVIINHGEKDEAKYMTDLHYSIDPIGPDPRHTFKNEDPLLASDTALD